MPRTHERTHTHTHPLTGQGNHAQGRRLVFVGDLVDRGPDSVSIVEFVRKIVSAGKAQMVLGNHEMNLLRGERKHGNHWFWGLPEVIRKDKAAIRSFCSRYPLQLD